MPFKSEKQRKYLFANEPKIAKQWAKNYNDGGLAVPQIKANAAGIKPVIASKPKGDPTGLGLKGQALTGGAMKSKRNVGTGPLVKKKKGGFIVVRPRGFGRMLKHKRPQTKIYGGVR